MSTTREFLGETGSPGRMRLSRGGFFAAAIPLVLSAAMITWPSGGEKIQMTASHEVPAAQGTITVKNSKNHNTDVTVKVQHLAEPSSLTPPADVYVVWFQPSGQDAKNEGELMVQGNRGGDLKTETPFKHFEVFITAEKNARVEQPTGPRVLSGTVTAP